MKYRLWRIDKPGITPGDFYAVAMGKMGHVFLVKLEKGFYTGLIPSKEGLKAMEFGSTDKPELAISETPKYTWLVTPGEPFAEVLENGRLYTLYQILAVYSSDYWFTYVEGYEWDTHYYTEAKVLPEPIKITPQMKRQLLKYGILESLKAPFKELFSKR